MRAGRVFEAAEFGEVAAAAERRAVPGQNEFGDRRVETRDLERLEHCGTHVGGKRVVPLRPVEPDAQSIAITVGLYGIGEVGDGGRPAFGQPARNSGPDCTVEYASDSVMMPARAGPAGSIERSTSSQTAAACGHRRHRSVSSASAWGTDATATMRRSSQSCSVSVKVASSEGDPTAMTTPLQVRLLSRVPLYQLLLVQLAGVRARQRVSKEIDRGHL